MLDDKLRDAKLLLKKGQLQNAVESFQQILDAWPDNADALYYLAVCHRKTDNSDTALETLDRLKTAHPDYARAYQEEGHIFRSREQSDAARKAYEHAVAFNPALPASWKALVPYYDAAGQSDKASEAKQHVAWLSSLPPQLVTVTSLINENKLFMAEQLCRHFLQEQPHHVEAMRLLAELGNRLLILDDAEFLLESCVEFQPDYHRARLDYVRILHKRQKYGKALEQAEYLHAAEPNNVGFEVAMATENQAAGHFDEALTIYNRVLERQPQLHTVHSARAHALKTIGRTDEAVESYHEAYQSKPDYGDAYWSLANLKTYRFEDAELRQMREMEALASTTDVDRIHLCFALGKALEDRAVFDESFTYYDRGNQLKKRESRYKPERIENEFDLQKQDFDAAFFEQRPGFGCPDKAPIFVVGLPRAGSTLLEQILASHSEVDGTMELANIIGLAHQLNGRRALSKDARYPKILHELKSARCQELGEKYIADTMFHRQGRDYFIDKMPNNFRHIALIQMILPNAKIIDARRHPMACCFSGFKQLFAEGQEFTYGLEDIGRYYKAYVDIMDHWDRELPGKILRVYHENVIADLETEVRRMLDYCGLPFENACLEFHRTERAVKTPSSEQVRQPIYTSGLEQWRNFEDYLQPLVNALGDARDY
ncbi:MAG: sulfotransferase [Gammaproteobacteria bacterium]|nr:sulfotransferase [Gammaproteobacteria bacterium]NNL51586.1 tetratricopeptide repeat protein [Woeseiaceae bacterium]